MVSTYRPTAIDLENTTDMKAVASQARTLIPLDDLFLNTKFKTVFIRKIKFEICVYEMTTGEARRCFRPEEKFLVRVSRGLPERVGAKEVWLLLLMVGWDSLFHLSSGRRCQYVVGERDKQGTSAELA